jgi:hypothetical protein
MIKIELVVDEEQLKEIFEDLEIKFSKKRMKELQEIINDDFSSVEEGLGELIQEIIQEEWGE